MTFTTKYEPEQKVFFMKDNKVCSDDVKAIFIKHDFPSVASLTPVYRETETEYILFGNPGVMIAESRLFGSKEELLKSL